jgi:hypothetical protein
MVFLLVVVAVSVYLLLVSVCGTVDVVHRSRGRLDSEGYFS